MKQPDNSIGARISALIGGMTLDEKLAQLVGVWVEAGTGPGAEVAPLQDAMESERLPFEEFARDGLGQITRFYGTAPVDPQAASDLLHEKQRWLVEHTRTGIPAIVHE
jgi:beta-xylosidase